MMLALAALLAGALAEAFDAAPTLEPPQPLRTARLRAVGDLMVHKRQLELARSLNLPVIVHDREAHGDSLDLVKAHPNARGVFHCYSGSVEDAKTLVILGWNISFTGVITFKNACKALEVLEMMPPERILIETDSPYVLPYCKDVLPPKLVRRTRNSALILPRVIREIAQLQGRTWEDVERITTENAIRLYRLPVKQN